jgi:hypothetical protein
MRTPTGSLRTGSTPVGHASTRRGIRRASICLALLGLIVLGIPAVSWAGTPSIPVFKVTPGPTLNFVGGGTWPKTGNCPGCGATLELEYEFEGTSYDGGIPPVSKLNLYLPAGVRLQQAGFGECTEATLRSVGPSGCPPNSIASPIGNVRAEISFGGERVPEELELRAFFGEGGLLFYMAGTSPEILEIISKGHWVKARAPYSQELITLVPPVATVAGAPLMSVRSIQLKLGAAIQKGKHGRTPYFRLKRKVKKKACEGGLPFNAEVTFGGMEGDGREFGIPPETVTRAYLAPCPAQG